MEVQAARLQASRIYRLTKLFYPDKISFDNGQVAVTKFSMFGLGRSEEVVSLSTNIIGEDFFRHFQLDNRH